jgi:hypothetical protein
LIDKLGGMAAAQIPMFQTRKSNFDHCTRSLHTMENILKNINSYRTFVKNTDEMTLAKTTNRLRASSDEDIGASSASLSAASNYVGSSGSTTTKADLLHATIGSPVLSSTSAAMIEEKNKGKKVLHHLHHSDDEEDEHESSEGDDEEEEEGFVSNRTVDKHHSPTSHSHGKHKQTTNNPVLAIIEKKKSHEEQDDSALTTVNEEEKGNKSPSLQNPADILAKEEIEKHQLSQETRTEEATSNGSAVPPISTGQTTPPPSLPPKRKIGRRASTLEDLVAEANKNKVSSVSVENSLFTDLVLEPYDHKNCSDCSFVFGMANDCSMHLAAIQHTAQETTLRLQRLLELRERMKKRGTVLESLDWGGE